MVCVDCARVQSLNRCPRGTVQQQGEDRGVLQRKLDGARELRRCSGGRALRYPHSCSGNADALRTASP